MMTIYPVVFVLSILFSFLLTRSVRRMAVAQGWAVAPASDRHIHRSSIPRLGGVAIFLSFITVLGILLATLVLFQAPVNVSPGTVLYILIPGTLVFLVGLYDDFNPVRPNLKFGVQAVAGTMLFFGGFQIFQIPLLFGEQKLGWIALPLTILWVLWITNAFNLIDGVDGLAAGSALFSTVVVFVVSLVSTNHLVSLLTIALAGSILGFLRFNFNPATIFLGDCGSLFIGYMLSALSLAGAQKTPTMVAVAIPIVSFGLPVLETVISVIRRYMSGQPIFGADREHIHHKLLDRGLSQKQVVIILYGVSALFGLLSLFLLYPSGPTVGIVLFVVGAGIWMGVQHLGYHEFFELKRMAQRTIDQKKIMRNNLAIRRAIRALSKAQDSRQMFKALTSAFEANDFDGFQLCCNSLGLEPTIDARNSCLDQGHRDCFIWRKVNGIEVVYPSAHVWTITLDLVTSDMVGCGYFSLYRAYSDKPLLADINLLTSEFHLALGDAVSRVVFESQTFSREVSEDRSPVMV
ncbi:MAG TPA: MraY family glycosyltransferase [Blastocatellia bacterium]|jgi:UDP-GlcNAc:undecaprenyl-phosphate GlcNAc-1-phosphate transferase|nr:MraY family glycosyltransferase [Blastocatellia bacterium]